VIHRKRSLDCANVANRIERAIEGAWPEIARSSSPLVWFTGSSVWRFLYPDLPDEISYRDWDIFTIGEAPALGLAQGMGWYLSPACRTRDKWSPEGKFTVDTGNLPSSKPRPGESAGYGDGFTYRTDRGEVDLWIASTGDPFAEVAAYPERSHAHCRAAFSPGRGLIVMPNPIARATGGDP